MQRLGKQIQPQFGPEKAFGQALREMRRARHVSQLQFALDTGFDRTYISLLERGVQSPTLRTIVKLAEHLRVSPSEMIRRMEIIQEERPGKEAGGVGGPR